MIKVKVLETFHVAATGITYQKGSEVEVSEEMAKKYEGRRFKSVRPIQPVKETNK